MNRATIDFYFDFLSPYSYLAFLELKKMQTEFPFDLAFYPISVPLLISKYETKGPGEIKVKRNYLMKDLLRKTSMQKWSFCPPEKLPFNSLYALRLSLLNPEEIFSDEFRDFKSYLISVFFKAAWGQGIDIGLEENAKSLLTLAFKQYDEEHNLELSDELLEQKVQLYFDLSFQKECKLKLKNQTEAAFHQGLFGVPSMIVQLSSQLPEKEIFWGHDSMIFLKMYLQGCDP